jgi:hypothetical protein
VFKDRKPIKTKSGVSWEKKNGRRNQWWKQFNKFRKQIPKQKGHPHPWRDGTQLGQICQILLLWNRINIRN